MQPNIVFEMDAPKAARHHLKRLGENQTENGGGSNGVKKRRGERRCQVSHSNTCLSLWRFYDERDRPAKAHHRRWRHVGSIEKAVVLVGRRGPQAGVGAEGRKAITGTIFHTWVLLGTMSSNSSWASTKGGGNNDESSD